MQNHALRCRVWDNSGRVINMRVLLVQFSAKHQGFPLGLAYVAGTLLREGHQVSFIDLGFEADPLAALSLKIRQTDSQAVGVTLYTMTYGEFHRLFSRCDACRTVFVVAGGVHAEIAPEQVLRDGLVNVVVRFEGEVVAPKLFRILESGGDLSTVKGIGFLDKNGKCVLTDQPKEYANLDQIPGPAYDLMQVRNYRRIVHGHQATYVMTARGCPYRCVFCHRGPSSGKRIRFMSVERVMEELELLHSGYDFRSFVFYDDLFNLDCGRVMDLCEHIIRSGLRLHWICEARVDAVDLEMLKRMKRAGCVGIHFGVESGHPDILLHLNKRSTVEDIEHAFALCREIRIPTVAYIMLGTPWDTAETYDKTMALLKKIKPTVTQFFAARPFPGTELREAFIEKGMFIPDNYDDYAYYVEGEMGAAHPSGYMEHEAGIRTKCVDSTKAMIRSQLRDIRHYPRLISDFVDMYGAKRFIHDAWQRLRLFRVP